MTPEFRPDEATEAAALKAVGDAIQARHDAAAAEDQAVLAAYQMRVTVQAIADALGVPQPHVTRKYGHLFKGIVRAEPGGEALEARAAAVAKVREARLGRLAADDLEVEAVCDALNLNVQWQRIADELGMARSNTVQKFNRLTKRVPVQQPAWREPLPLRREAGAPSAGRSGTA